MKTKQMKITLNTSTGTTFGTFNSFASANIGVKSIFKRKYYSDIYYTITFDDNETVKGSIDLEPYDFHSRSQNEIFTTHLKTFWTNISKATPGTYGITKNDIKYFKNLLTRL